MTTTTQEQPPPKPNDRPAIWPLVIADLEAHSRVRELVAEDAKARDAHGRAQYGCPLQPFNGRDALVDAFQEQLDATVYLRQAIEEGSPVRPLYIDSLALLLRLRNQIALRDGK